MIIWCEICGKRTSDLDCTMVKHSSEKCFHVFCSDKCCKIYVCRKKTENKEVDK